MNVSRPNIARPVQRRGAGDMRGARTKGCGVAATLRPRRFGASRHPISEPGPELEAHAVLGVVVGGLAAGGVEADLEAGVAPEDRTEPSTDAVIACSVIGERKTRVERAGEAPAEEGNAVARLGPKAPCRLEACARRGPARIVRPPRPLRRARRGAQGGDEGERALLQSSAHGC